MSKLMNAIEGISDEHIKEFAFVQIPQRTIPVWVKIGSLAASLVLVVMTVTLIVSRSGLYSPVIGSESESEYNSGVLSYPQTDNSENKSEYDSSEPLECFAPDVFESFKDFEEHEKNAKTNAVSFYYVPASIPSGFELTQIAKRDNIYVMVTYSISAAAMPSNNAQEYTGLNSYDSERLQTLICERSLSPDGQRSLEAFIANDYEPIEYEGRTYYRWDEHAENNPEKRVIGYELAFLNDDSFIFLHLPAIDTFENMMRYADVAKVEIN